MTNQNKWQQWQVRHSAECELPTRLCYITSEPLALLVSFIHSSLIPTPTQRKYLQSNFNINMADENEILDWGAEDDEQYGM